MNSAILAVVLATVWLYALAAAIATGRFARRGRKLAAEVRPPVTILKPLYGAEPGLFENLASFGEQDYPEYQIVFGVRDRTDAAIPIARRLMDEKPHSDIALIVDPHVTGSNLKVANLENMVPSARHDLFVLADSDMRVAPHYLDMVTAPLADSRVGLVTCLYEGVPGEGLWSRLAALHINYGFLPGAVLGHAMQVGGGCFGATIALRRDVFERIGGFARLRHELADDHRMGSAVRRLGLSVVLSPYVVANQVTEPTFSSLWQHELRWARTSRAMAPGGYTGSLVTHTVPVTALAVALLGSDPLAWGFVGVSVLLRWLSAAAIARRLGFSRAGLWLLPLRDFLSFAIYLGSFCGRNVQWRNQSFRVEASGRMSLEGDKPV
ncbi:MAG: bacteriohopanetetrol glucosamine biosynthesis glycosyltransferase HpnI [Alphaproteobacteria bacterium]|nr:bacteriohopanetetrol glucosamine biosynthesis glycosyltransferase HpnI [Alphaproteobacteria bacterium]